MQEEQQRETMKHELLTRLQSHNVPLAEWGNGEARTLDDLMNEIASGEATLEEMEDGRLLRVVRGARVHVFYEDAGGQYKLVEDRQEYIDGRIRRRMADLDMSIGEKMKPGEDAEAAARRSLEEELGVRSGFNLTSRAKLSERISPSKAFPGLSTKYISHDFDVTLLQDQFRPEGYVEVQPDKTTYFIWQKIDNGLT